jgi:hypothetical protein
MTKSRPSIIVTVFTESAFSSSSQTVPVLFIVAYPSFPWSIVLRSLGIWFKFGFSLLARTILYTQQVLSRQLLNT